MSRGSSSSYKSPYVEGIGTEPVLMAAEDGGGGGGGVSSLPDKGCLRALTGIMRCSGRQHNEVVYISKARCTLLEAGLVLTQALHKD